MANTTISANAASGACDGIVDLFDVGITNPGAQIIIYQGPQPDDPDQSPNQNGTSTPLITFQLPDTPTFDDATNGIAPARTNPTNILPVLANVAVNGVAQWFRCFDRAGTSIVDGDVSTAVAGTGDMQIDDINLNVGEQLRLNTWVYIMPQT